MHCLVPIIIVTLALTIFLFLGVKILDYINSMKTRKSELYYKLYMLNY